MTTNAKLAEDVVRVRDANRLPDGGLQFRGVVGRTNPRLDEFRNRTESLANDVEQVFLPRCDQTSLYASLSAGLNTGLNTGLNASFNALFPAFLEDRLIRR